MNPPRRRAVLIAVVVTDRTDSLLRLLASLEPLRDDPSVSLLVLDNGREAVPASLNAASPLPLNTVRASSPRLPLAAARRELSLAAAEHPDAIVWMLDDDLTFEALVPRDGWLERVNVAHDRIAKARTLAEENPDLDLVAGWFTGDPPIRPEAVLACQLGDLAQLLRAARAPAGRSHWEHVALPLFEGDYYYDHAELSPTGGPDQRYPWLPRAGPPWGFEAELREALRASGALTWGGAPFRPLVEQTGPPALSETILRGGNCLLLSRRALLDHPYPSFPVAGTWSRRADMIGATLFARRSGTRAAEMRLTLHHDRRGQRLVSSDPADWAAEFAGVLLARLILGRVPRALWGERVSQLAAERLGRVLGCARLASDRCTLAREELRETLRAAPWSGDTREVALDLSTALDTLQTTLGAIEPEALRTVLLGSELRVRVLEMGEQLLVEEAQCAGS